MANHYFVIIPMTILVVIMVGYAVYEYCYGYYEVWHGIEVGLEGLNGYYRDVDGWKGLVEKGLMDREAIYVLMDKWRGL